MFMLTKDKHQGFAVLALCEGNPPMTNPYKGQEIPEAFHAMSGFIMGPLLSDPPIKDWLGVKSAGSIVTSRKPSRVIQHIVIVDAVL